MKIRFPNYSVLLLLASSMLLARCPTPRPKPVVVVPPKVVTKAFPDFMPSKWEALPDWLSQDLSASWPALQQSCRALRFRPVWIPICAAAEKVDKDDVMAQRTFYETWFRPYQVFNPDGSDTGLITGYYEPLLKGSRTRSEEFPYAI